MKSSVGLGLIIAVLASEQAHASEDGAFEEDAAADGASQRPSGFELSAGPQVTVGTGMVCRRESSDEVGCFDGPTAAGFRVIPQWRINDMWSVGVLGEVGWGGSYQWRTSLWRTGAEARWRPFTRHTLTPWLGLGAGALLIVDDLDAGELGPAISYSNWAPVVSVGLGLDLALSSSFALGVEVDAVALGLGSSGQGWRQRQPRYQDNIATSVALVASFLGG